MGILCNFSCRDHSLSEVSLLKNKHEGCCWDQQPHTPGFLLVRSHGWFSPLIFQGFSEKQKLLLLLTRGSFPGVSWLQGGSCRLLFAEGLHSPIHSLCSSEGISNPRNICGSSHNGLPFLPNSLHRAHKQQALIVLCWLMKCFFC